MTLQAKRDHAGFLCALPLVFLVLTSTAAGLPAQDTGGTPVPKEATLSGNMSLAVDASFFVANTDEEWAQATALSFGPERGHAEWLAYDVNGNEIRGRAPGRSVHDKMLPPMELADHTAIFIFAGILPSGVHAVAVKSVVEKADAVEVRYDVARAEDVRRALEHPSPFTLLFVPKAGKPVRFVHGEKAVATVGGAAAEVVNGLQLLLDVQPTAWKIGDRIEFGCTVKNVTGKPWRIFRWGLGSSGALELADDVGGVVKPQFMRDATRKLTDADCPFIRESQRFTLGGRILRDGTLVVNEPQGGEFTWKLTAGAFTLRATCGVKEGDWTLPMEQMEMRWTGKVRSNAVQVTVPGGAARVDLDESHGLKLTLEADSANWKPGDKIKLTCVAKNTSDKPIRIPAWGLDMYAPLVITDAAGKKLPEPSYGCKHCREYTADDFPTLAPGETKSFTVNASLDAQRGKQFLTVWEGRGGAYGWELPNGVYQVSASAENKDPKERVAFQRGDGKLVMLWTGKAVSPPVKAAVGEAAGAARVDLAPTQGDAVNGLALSLEVKPASWRPGDAIEFVCTATNVSDKPVRVPAWGLDPIQVIEFTDAQGKTLANPGFRRTATRMIAPADFALIEPGQSRRFTLGGFMHELVPSPAEGKDGKRWLSGGELCGGAFAWTLPEGEWTLRAVFDVRPNAEWDKLAGGACWTGKAFSAPAKVTFRTEALAWGEEVNGLRLALEAHPMTWKPGEAIEFACTVKNVSRKFLNVSAWGLDLAQAVEITDAKGKALPNDGGRNGLRPMPADAFPTIPPGELRRFTLAGRITDKKMLIVNELLGGVWHWTLADGDYTLRAAFDRTGNDEFLKRQAARGLWTGKAFSAPVKVTVGDAPAAAKVDLAPAGEPGAAAGAPGEAVNGIELTLDVKPAAWSPGAGIELGCAAKNVADKPVRVATWGLQLAQALELTDAKGRVLPHEGGSNRSRLARAEDFVVIAPGQSKRFTLSGQLNETKMLIVNEPLGGIWYWQLADGGYTARAVFRQRDRRRGGRAQGGRGGRRRERRPVPCPRPSRERPQAHALGRPHVPCDDAPRAPARHEGLAPLERRADEAHVHLHQHGRQADQARCL
jgi:hypothetical protein